MNIFSSHPNRPLTMLALVATLLWLLNVAPATPTQAAGPVNNCTFQGLANAITSGNGLINFTCGPATINLTQSGGLNVDAGHFYTIDGGNLITLSGGDHNRLFNVKAGGALTLTNIILSNGFVGSDGYIPTLGGALLNNGGLLVLDHATVRDSQSTGGGGGLETLDGATLVSDSLIENNQSDTGGGLQVITGTLSLINTTVRQNHALTDTGGGLDLGGTVTISNSQIDNNSAVQNVGGGVAVFGNVTISDSRLEANRALYGGGIAVGAETVLTLTRSTLSGNTATGGGGGVYNQGAWSMTNVTISGNTATTAGGGVYNANTSTMLNVTVSANSATTGGGLYMSLDSTTALTNTILDHSPSGGNCAGQVTASKYTISSDQSCGLGLVAGGSGNHDNLDPLLTALGHYGGPTRVHMLKLGSPAIAGVVGNDAPSTDQRGQPRPGPDGNYDIGAVERQPDDSVLAPWLYMPLIIR